MKKIFLLSFVVLISMTSFGQTMKLYAVRLNNNSTTDSFFVNAVAGAGIWTSGGVYVMPKVDSMAAIEGFEMPNSLGKFFLCADGVYRNFAQKSETIHWDWIASKPSAVTNLSGNNTGDQDLSGLMVKANNLSDLTNASTARTNLGVNTTANISNSTNKNFVTDANLTVIQNTSGNNTGDNATNTQYSGLAASKENTIAAGTTAQYWRGDKTFQTLNSAAVGLGNVDNTSDATKNAAAVNLTNKTIGAFNAALDAGANDSYTISLSPAPAAYTTGMIVIFRANTQNTTGCSINVNGLGNRTIVKRVNTTPATGDILALMWCMLIYDGTNFVLLNPVVN